MRLIELQAHTNDPWLTISMVRGFVNRGVDLGRGNFHEYR